MNSADVEWRLGGEVFRILAAAFDVDAAKRTLARAPRESVKLDVAGAAALVGPPGRPGVIRVDPARVAGADLSVPLIVATVRGELLVVDGWHRVAKASAAGVTELDGFVLDESETEAVRLGARRGRRKGSR